jgi:hypothetical protein
MQDWQVGQGLDSSGKNDIGVTQGDLIRGVVDGLSRGGARPIQGVCGDAGGELREEAHLARNIRRQSGRYDLAEDDLVDLTPVHLASIE